MASFGAGLADPDLIRGAAICTFSPSSRDKPGLLGQRHHRHQPGARHEMVIIEHRRRRGEPMRHLHRKCLSELGRLMRENTNHPSSEGTVTLVSVGDLGGFVG